MDLHSPLQWLQLCADDFSATVSLQTLLRHPDSMLAGLAQTAVSSGSTTLRLDMSPDICREVVSCLRLGDGYQPPEDSRLLAAVQHQLDYLGLPQPADMPARQPAAQSYLFVHCYTCADPEDLGFHETAFEGLPLFTTRGGWSVLHSDRDPRPRDMLPQFFDYAATTLPKETTGACQDLMLVSGPGPSGYLMDADTRTCHAVPSCPGFSGRLMSVGGKAYMLGQGISKVQCYDPVLNCWFSASHMPGKRFDFAAAAPPGSNILVMLGGFDGETGAGSGSIDCYDTRSRAWSSKPSGAALPHACAGLAAAALDSHRVLVFGGNEGQKAQLLELRMWRLLPAGQLNSSRMHSAGVNHEGTVMALGGMGKTEDGDWLKFLDTVEAYDEQSNSWSVVSRLPSPMSGLAATSARVSPVLHLNR